MDRKLISLQADRQSKGERRKSTIPRGARKHRRPALEVGFLNRMESCTSGVESD